MGELEIEIDGEKLIRAINDGEGTVAAIRAKTDAIAARANSMSAGFTTGRFYDRTEGKLKGGKQPHYGSDTRKMRSTVVGIVYTGNYAAKKENHEHNTLLKSI